MTYEQAYQDWEYLWSIAPAHDMTGSYVDQEDLAKLLKKPTKKTAKECLCAQIDYWFQAGPDIEKRSGGNSSEYIENDLKVKEIAERHCCI